MAAVPEELTEAHAEFAGLRTVGMVFSERQVAEGPVAVQTGHYISSLRPKKAFAAAVRGHWSIENQPYRVLDVAFHEDGSRVRKDHAPENLGLVRRITLSLLKRVLNKKRVGVACKRKQAGWNDAYLVQVLRGQQE